MEWIGSCIAFFGLGFLWGQAKRDRMYERMLADADRDANYRSRQYRELLQAVKERDADDWWKNGGRPDWEQG